MKTAAFVLGVLLLAVIGLVVVGFLVGLYEEFIKEKFDKK